MDHSYVASLNLELPHHVIPAVFEAESDEDAIAKARQAFTASILPDIGATISLMRFDGTVVSPAIPLE